MATNRMKKSEAVHRLWKLADSKEAIIFLSDCLFYLSICLVKRECKILSIGQAPNTEESPKLQLKEFRKTNHPHLISYCALHQNMVYVLHYPFTNIKKTLRQWEQIPWDKKFVLCTEVYSNKLSTKKTECREWMTLSFHTQEKFRPPSSLNGWQTSLYTSFILIVRVNRRPPCQSIRTDASRNWYSLNFSHHLIREKKF